MYKPKAKINQPPGKKDAKKKGAFSPSIQTQLKGQNDADHLPASLTAEIVKAPSDFSLDAGNIQAVHQSAEMAEQLGARAYASDSDIFSSDSLPAGSQSLAEQEINAPNQHSAESPVQREGEEDEIQSEPLEATAEASVEPESAETVEEALPSFAEDYFDQSGDDFDMAYTPNGPLPAMGTLEIQHWVHIDYNPFSESVMQEMLDEGTDPADLNFSPEQLADFEWSAEEMEKFEADLMTSMDTGWSQKYRFVLNDPDFAQYQTEVFVNFAFISDPDSAHTVITAQKVPEGAPRYRSFVDGDTATLDIRDPSELETFEVYEKRQFLEQVGSFGFDSAEINGDIAAQVSEIDEMIEAAAATPGIKDGTDEWKLTLEGLASSEGNAGYNERLGRRRAEAVEDAISADTSWLSVEVDSTGEEKSTEESRFRMVIVALEAGTQEVTQNVAAHEAGHMMGLDDEYEDGDVHRVEGDEPDNYDELTEIVGPDAEEALAEDSESMMSSGSTVDRVHYAYFLRALRDRTGMQGWDFSE